MRENREISNAPSAVSEGGSVKAQSRTTDRYAMEKSDCAVGARSKQAYKRERSGEQSPVSSRTAEEYQKLGESQVTG